MHPVDIGLDQFDRRQFEQFDHHNGDDKHSSTPRRTYNTCRIVDLHDIHNGTAGIPNAVSFEIDTREDTKRSNDPGHFVDIGARGHGVRQSKRNFDIADENDNHCHTSQAVPDSFQTARCSIDNHGTQQGNIDIEHAVPSTADDGRATRACNDFGHCVNVSLEQGRQRCQYDICDDDADRLGKASREVHHNPHFVQCRFDIFCIPSTRCVHDIKRGAPCRSHDGQAAQTSNFADSRVNTGLREHSRRCGEFNDDDDDVKPINASQDIHGFVLFAQPQHDIGCRRDDYRHSTGLVQYFSGIDSDHNVATSICLRNVSSQHDPNGWCADFFQSAEYGNQHGWATHHRPFKYIDVCDALNGGQGEQHFCHDECLADDAYKETIDNHINGRWADAPEYAHASSTDAGHNDWLPGSFSQNSDVNVSAPRFSVDGRCARRSVARGPGASRASGCPGRGRRLL
mmetsp:Transcript_65023/g.188543  ORF Transcript_65023/g.188543 Transcript_65023/m.188543 type:complete len:456 (+) Transcript_65023:796-2163(+)